MSQINRPEVSTSKRLLQESLLRDKSVETVNDSNPDVYENVHISEGYDICETEESDTNVSKRIRSGSCIDSSCEKIVLQT